MTTETKPARTETITKGLYRDVQTGRYYVRPYVNGRRTQRWLKARTEAEAVKEFIQRDHAAPVTSVKQLVQAYIEAGTPGAGIIPRKGEFAQQEKARCELLADFFGNMKADNARLSHCMDYHKWRVKKIDRNVAGGRTVDLDLCTLSNVFSYGTRANLVKGNPFSGRPRFAPEAIHCRERCCRSGDELHTVAKALGGIIALQFLFESCSGCRTGEAIPLRRDASIGKPGHIRQGEEGRYLCISRLKQGGDDPYDYILINPALAEVLRALDDYHAKRKKPSKWFFPGRMDGADDPIAARSLTHGLARVASKLLPEDRHLTSHGCRAFYVTWRRCQRIHLIIIAGEIGQSSGVKLIEDVYGRTIPAWADRDSFSPFPKTVEPFWGSGLATENATSGNSTAATSHSTLQLVEATEENCIVLFGNHNQHTSTS